MFESKRSGRSCPDLEEMSYLPDEEPLPVGLAPGAGPFGGGDN